MSKVVDIRTALNTLISSTLSGYVKLPDSVDSPDNPDIILNKGFSVGFSSGENTSREWCIGTIMVTRQFQIVLTNLYTPNMDANYREGLENSLMNDEFAVIAALEESVTLAGNAVSSRFILDNGLGYLIAESGKQYIVIVITCSVTYEENT
jgi:hypothetical protein